MTPVLLDTGCIVALLDRSEQHHRQCVDVVSGLKAPLVTCEAVIAESCYLLRQLQGASEAIIANVERGTFQIPLPLADLAKRVKALLHKYRDVPMDLADGCLVAIAEHVQTGRILTLGTDFEVYRWHRNRPFENLLTL